MEGSIATLALDAPSPELVAWLEQEKLVALAEFAAGAGHEINNPLAVISGRAQLLLQYESHPERRRDLALIQAQAMRIHEMIAGLMHFARPPLPERCPGDLAASVQRCVDELQPRATLAGVVLRCAYEAGPWPASFDPVQWHVALRSVIDNALAAVGQGGTIDVRLERRAAAEGVVLNILVADDGPGFSAEARRHAFDPFFSGHAAGRGLGIGLSRAWRIVQDHGGRITIGDPPRGAEIILSLPSCEVEPKPSATESSLTPATEPSDPGADGQ